MVENEKYQFATLMYALAENYTGTHLTEAGLALRFEAMKGFTIAQISKAATRIVQTRKSGFMPTVGEIIEVIKEIEGNGELSIEQKAEIEAIKILEFLKCYGKTKTPEFDDPISKHLMATRWKYYSWASAIEESELKWWQKDFIRAYTAYSEGEKTGYHLTLQGRIKELVAGIVKPIPMIEKYAVTNS